MSVKFVLHLALHHCYVFVVVWFVLFRSATVASVVGYSCVDK